MLSGLSAFPLTPMDQDGVVYTDHLGRMVARLARSGVDSIGVLGSTGSYMYLNADQRAWAISAAVSYLPLSDADFAGLVADVTAVSALPICLYNNPGTTHFTMSADLVATLAANPQVVAVKNPAPATSAVAEAQIAFLRRKTPDGFVIGYSGDALIHVALGAGADAWYSVIAGVLPDLALAIWNARGDDTRLCAEHAKAAALWEVFKTYGAIHVAPHILEFSGLGRAPLPRPLQPLSNDILAKIDAALDATKVSA